MKAFRDPEEYAPSSPCKHWPISSFNIAVAAINFVVDLIRVEEIRGMAANRTIKS